MVKADISTANKLPNRKKLPDLSIVLPNEPSLSLAKVILSPGLFIVSNILFKVSKSSVRPV